MKLSKEQLDALTAGYKTPQEMESLYSQMLQHTISRSLEAEMHAHLGHERHGRDPLGLQVSTPRPSCNVTNTCIPLDQVRRGDLPFLAFVGIGPTVGSGAALLPEASAAVVAVCQSPRAKEVARDTLYRTCAVAGLCGKEKPDQVVGDDRRKLEIREGMMREAAQEGKITYPKHLVP